MRDTGVAGKAPDVPGLRSAFWDGRRIGTRPQTAILIPSSRGGQKLEAHLKELSRQQFSVFDVIAVYGETDAFVEPPEGISILHVREKGRLGCAGAYYLAERIALEEGYSFIIEADDDCLPWSDRLVAELVASAKSGNHITIPHVMFGHGSAPAKPLLPHYYGCFRRECFEKAGLTFLPLFLGGEDIEIMERMRRAGFAAVHDGVEAYHPKMRPVLITPPMRAYYYYKGEVEACVLSGLPLRALNTCATYLILASAQAAFGNWIQARLMAKAMLDASAMKLYEDSALFGVFGGIGMPGIAGWLDGSEVQGPDGRGARGFLEVVRSWARGASCFGKTVVFGEWSGVHSLPAALLAGSACIGYEGKPRELFRGRGALRIAAGLAIMAASLPAIILASPILVARGFVNARIRNPGNEGYGAGIVAGVRGKQAIAGMGVGAGDADK